MALSRATVADLATQVKPTFMLPAVGMSLFGALLSPTLAVVPAILHAVAVGAALYVAHLVDEYVDAHLRGEERPTVSRPTLRLAAVVATGGCLAAAGLLWVRGATLAAVLVFPLLLLALLHAPVLDRNPVTVTVDYPVGIALAVVGGYAAQQRTVAFGTLVTAVVFVVVLSGVKVSLDRLDADFDRQVDKRTLPVVLGDRQAARVGALLASGAALVVAASAVLGRYPTGTLIAVPALLLVGLAGLDDSPARATRRQMALVYVVALVLFVTQCLATGCFVGRQAELLETVVPVCASGVVRA